MMLLEYVQRNMLGGKWNLATQGEIRLRRMKSVLREVKVETFWLTVNIV